MGLNAFYQCQTFTIVSYDIKQIILHSIVISYTNTMLDQRTGEVWGWRWGGGVGEGGGSRVTKCKKNVIKAHQFIYFVKSCSLISIYNYMYNIWASTRENLSSGFPTK